MLSNYDNPLWKCPNNSEVVCKPHERNCDRCGWNPEVAQARLERIIQQRERELGPEAEPEEAVG